MESGDAATPGVSRAEFLSRNHQNTMKQTLIHIRINGSINDKHDQYQRIESHCARNSFEEP